MYGCDKHDTAHLRSTSGVRTVPFRSLTETWLVRFPSSWHGTGMNKLSQQYLTRRGLLQVLASAGVTVAVAVPGARANAPAASQWSEASHSSLRLLRGSSVKAGDYRAGIVLRMRPGFKTYWRHPGDSGVPPVFRFDGSQNLGEAVVHFPVPRRFDDGTGGISFGYTGSEIILPVTVTARNPKQPVVLRLEADYAVCEKLCVPAHGKAEIELSNDGRSPHDDALRDAMGTIPAITKLGTAGAVQVMALRKGHTAEHFLVDVNVPAGVTPELFIEGETPWFLETKGFSPATGGQPATFSIMVIDRDKSPDCLGANLTLTLAAGSQAIEVRTRLDMELITP
jgi:DsbC/DsbD-like thiol-disulfide interchange protein